MAPPERTPTQIVSQLELEKVKRYGERRSFRLSLIKVKQKILPLVARPQPPTETTSCFWPIRQVHDRQKIEA